MKKPDIKLTLFAVLAAVVSLSACTPETNTGSLSETQGVTATETAAEEETERTPEETVEPVITGNGFTSPEEAVEAYLYYLKNGDLSSMMDTFAAEAYVDYVIPRMYAEEDEGYLIESRDELPEVYYFSRDSAVIQREGEVTDQILRQYMILCEVGWDVNNAIPLKEESDRVQFLAQFEESLVTTRFQDMKLLGYIPTDESDLDERFVERTAKMRYADQSDCRIAVIEMGDSYFALLFELVEFEGAWYNYELGGWYVNILDFEQNTSGTIALSMSDMVPILGYLTPPQTELLSGSTRSEPVIAAGYEAAGYKSAQEAAKAYLEGVKVSNISQMLSTFAIETYLESHGLMSYLEYMQCFTPMRQEVNLPAVNQLSKEINIEKRKANLAADIHSQYLTIAMFNGHYYGEEPEEKEWTDDMLSAEFARLSMEIDFNTLNVIGYIPPEEFSDTYGSEGARNIRIKSAERYGADNIEGSVVVFEVDGNKYFLCSEAINYNGKWYNLQLGGQVSGLLGLPADCKGTFPFDDEQWGRSELLVIPFE